MTNGKYIQGLFPGEEGLAERGPPRRSRGGASSRGPGHSDSDSDSDGDRDSDSDSDGDSDSDRDRDRDGNNSGSRAAPGGRSPRGSRPTGRRTRVRRSVANNKKTIKQQHTTTHKTMKQTITHKLMIAIANKRVRCSLLNSAPAPLLTFSECEGLGGADGTPSETLSEALGYGFFRTRCLAGRVPGGASWQCEPFDRRQRCRCTRSAPHARTRRRDGHTIPLSQPAFGSERALLRLWTCLPSQSNSLAKLETDEPARHPSWSRRRRPRAIGSAPGLRAEKPTHAF